MDAYEIAEILDRMLGLADSLDETGVAGVKAISNGQYTTRETLRLELNQFLLYIGSGNNCLEDGEVALLNFVINRKFNASQWMQIALTTDAPNPASMTLMGFLAADKALTRQNGYKTTSTTDVLIQTFEAFGNLMIDFDKSSVSKARCAKYINGMKSYAMKNL